MFFQGHNGQSMTSYICEKNLKLFVTSASYQDTKDFRESLANYLKEDREFQELQVRLAEELQAKQAKFSEAFSKHLQHLKNLHIKHARELADASYNEFDHKIHVEADCKMYVVTKETVVDDLHQTIKFTPPTGLPEILVDDPDEDVMCGESNDG